MDAGAHGGHSDAAALLLVRGARKEEGHDVHKGRACDLALLRRRVCLQVGEEETRAGVARIPPIATC